MKRIELLKNKVKAVSAVAMANILMTGNRFVVWANGTGNGGFATSTGIPMIDNTLSTIKSIILGIIAGVGVIVFLKNLADTFEALTQHDSRGIYEGGRGLAAGLAMIGMRSILKAMGIL